MQIYQWATLIMVRWGWKDLNETVLCKISTPLDNNNPLSRALSFKACRFFFNLVQHNEQRLDECQIWALYQLKGVVRVKVIMWLYVGKVTHKIGCTTYKNCQTYGSSLTATDYIFELVHQIC